LHKVCHNQLTAYRQLQVQQNQDRPIIVALVNTWKGLAEKRYERVVELRAQLIDKQRELDEIYRAPEESMREF
jgi:hypothetical protein